MFTVYARDPAGQFGWLDLPYAPRSLERAIELLNYYRKLWPNRIYVIGREDAFGRPRLSEEAELAMTARLCEPITHDDVFELVG